MTKSIIFWEGYKMSFFKELIKIFWTAILIVIVISFTVSMVYRAECLLFLTSPAKWNVISAQKEEIVPILKIRPRGAKEPVNCLYAMRVVYFQNNQEYGGLVPFSEKEKEYKEIKIAVNKRNPFIIVRNEWLPFSEGEKIEALIRLFVIAFSFIYFFIKKQKDDSYSFLPDALKTTIAQNDDKRKEEIINRTIDGYDKIFNKKIQPIYRILWIINAIGGMSVLLMIICAKIELINIIFVFIGIVIALPCFFFDKIIKEEQSKSKLYIYKKRRKSINKYRYMESNHNDILKREIIIFLIACIMLIILSPFIIKYFET